MRLLASLRSFGHRSTRSALLLLRPGRRAGRRGRRGGDEHAVGRAPRVRLARAVSRALREALPRLALPGHGPRLRAARDARRARASWCTWPARGRPRRCSTRPCRSRAASSRPGTVGRRYPLPVDARAWPAIYFEAVAAALKGAPYHPHPARMTRAARSRRPRARGRMRGGPLTIEEGEPARTSSATRQTSSRASVTVHSPQVWPALLRGSVGLGRSYAAGGWDSDDLVASSADLRARDARSTGAAPVLAAAAPRSRRDASAEHARPGRARATSPPTTTSATTSSGSSSTSRMTYSCAVFDAPRHDARGGAGGKARPRLPALDLGPEHHVVEIGTGWGGFALHAAARYGCRVTTTTISAEQHALRIRAGRRGGPRRTASSVVDAGLPRPRAGTFDRLVSIEMIEAVGWRALRRVLPRLLAGCSRRTARCSSRRSSSTTAGYEAREAQRRLRQHADLPRRLPAVGARASTRSVARVTDMRVAGLEDITPHYAETLRRWRERFVAPRDERARARLRRGVPAPVGAVPRLLRGRLPRAADPRGADRRSRSRRTGE